PVTRAWGWLVRPRAIRVSPIGALAAAGLAFVAATLGMRRDATRQRMETAHTGEFPVATGEYPTIRNNAEPMVTAASSRTRDTVFVTRFMIVAPNARQVSLVGDFNDWDQASTPLLKVAANGVWTAEVKLPPGRYAYAFLVDGQRWIADPTAPPAVGDDFGRPSSVVTVRGIDA
ncbi:MAG: isoamylase early set domain-containing protein, partial [Gemmatirosa sp.]